MASIGRERADLCSGRTLDRPTDAHLRIQESRFRSGDNRRYTSSIFLGIHGLQRPGAAKRTHGKKYKQQRHGNGNANEPASHIAGPAAQRGIEPGEGHDAKHGSHGFVKQLFHDPPKALESAWFWTWGRR
jgi:hypothetical protein